MTLARYLCLGVPVVLVLAGLLVERDRRARAGALLAGIAAAVGIAVLHEAARVTGWYDFAPVDGAFRGLPVDLWLGWAALWGAVPVLVRRLVPLPVALGGLLWLDVVGMPALRPLVLLGPDWLVGEVVGLLAVALPAQLLGRWSADRRRLSARVPLQVLLVAAMTLWLVPTVAFEVGDGGWYRLVGLPPAVLFALAQLALLLATPALLAVREFQVRGHGTPYPWDPPERLVTTGPYAYVANPMQLSAVALLLLIDAATGSATLAGGVLLAVAFSVAVAGPHERYDLRGRYGPRWADYRRQVSDWWPRWRPYRSPDGPPAVLWLDRDCGPCSAVYRFLAQRDPVHLRLAPAAEHPEQLWRARYTAIDAESNLVSGSGVTVDGVAAVARGLEHLHLGWACAGWLLRLPGVTWLAQLVTDALIVPPHPAGGGRVGPRSARPDRPSRQR